LFADIGIVIGAAVGGVSLLAIGILVYWVFYRGATSSDTRIKPADTCHTSTPESDKNVSMAVDPVDNEEMTEAQLRREGWYLRYVQSVSDSLSSLSSKFPSARIKVIGVKPDNHAQYGARTRLEFKLLEHDLLKALRSGTSLKMNEPEMQRVKLEYLQDEIDKANQDEEAMQIVIASCPSQIGDDNTIMDQVRAMVGTGAGHRAVTCCFSHEGNVVSTLEKAVH